MPATKRAPWLLSLLVVFGLGAACTDDIPGGAPGRTGAARRGMEDDREAARRPITRPDHVLVTNAALGGSRRHVRRAIRDLRRIGMWQRLTEHLYSVRFATRPGRDQVPDDGHLADAYLTAQIDGRRGGPACDVMFFPAAMADDLERWRTYHGRGLLADPPPSARHFWAAITAHELAHCLGDGKGEGAAMRWERRALRRLGEGN